MKPKAIIKIIIDILMTFALLFLMGYQLWGDAAHEIAGAVLFLLFIVHHILNRSFYKNLFRGKYTPMRILQIVMVTLVFAVMLMLMYSGITMSRYVFDFLPVKGGMAAARRFHMLGAYWGFILMSMHLGLHWNMVLGMVKKGIRIKKDSKIRTAVCFIVGLVIAGYGGYVLFKRDFMTYLFLKTEFVFLDYSESPISFYIDYLAGMGLCIFVAHYITRLLRKIHSRKED